MNLGINLALGSVRAGGGAAPPNVTLATPFFYDDFNATNQSLTGRSGWTAFGDATKAATIKADNGVARMTTDFNGQSPYGYQMTAALPTTDRRVTFSIDVSQGFQSTGSADNASFPRQWSDQRIFLAWVDENNNIELTMDNGPNGASIRHRMLLTHRQGGTIVKQWRNDNIDPTGTYEAEIVDDRIRIRRNGQIIMGVDSPNLVTADNQHPDQVIVTPLASSRVGFGHGFHGFNICSGPLTVEAIRTTVNIGSRFYGRDASQGRTITVSGKYTVISGQPTQWAYRLLDEQTGAVVQNWTNWTPTAASGTYSGTIRLNQGGPYIVQVAWTDGVNNWFMGRSLGVAVGLLFVGWGQSNSADAGSRFITAYPAQGITTPGNYKIFGWQPAVGNLAARFIGEVWRKESLNTVQQSVSAMEFCRVVSSATGLPVGFGTTGVAAQAITTLMPGTANWDNVLVPFVAAMGGNCEGMVWTQGEAEALSVSPYNTYAANFATLVAGFRSQLANRSDAPVFIRMIGDDDSLTNTAPQLTRAFEARQVFVGLENPANNIWIGGYPLGLPKSDTIHYNGAEHSIWSRRVAYTVARRLGIGTPLTYDGRGPRPTGVTRSGATLTIALDMNGYSALAGSALTGYEVSADNFATLLTISSATVSGSTIVITLAAAPSGPVRVRSFMQANYDDSSLATAALPDGFRIPVEPIIVPLLSN